MRTRNAACLLAVVLVAYTLQTELASYVQHGLGYKKPYFLFYLTHSSYLLLFPLHLAVLAILPASATSTRIPTLLAELASTLEEKFQPPARSGSSSSTSSKGGSHNAASLRIPSSPKLYQHVEHRSVFGWCQAVKQALLVRVRAPWIDYLAKRVLLLTVLISAPALSWYGAVPLTSMTDITAIYNVFAFWAYLLSLYYLPAPAHLRVSSVLRILNFVAVLLAVSGVFVIAYGDAIAGGHEEEGKGDSGGYDSQYRLLGNGLALFGSVAYAGYEVWYKLHVRSRFFMRRAPLRSNFRAPRTDEPDISLPEPPDETPLQDLGGHTYEPAPSDDPDAGGLSAFPGIETETSSLLRAPSPSTNGLSSDPATPAPIPVESARRASPSFASHGIEARSRAPPPSQIVTPTLLLLYSNAITSLIGLCTLGLLWIPIPLLHWVGWEDFEVPPAGAGLAMVGIVLGGIVFNGGFMVLLSLWGPVTASVANLLTLLLVSLCDALFVPSAPPMTTSTLAGGGMIVCAFAVLIVAEMKGEGTAAAATTGTDAEEVGGGARSRIDGRKGLERISEEEVEVRR
ncbi:hypothetical protein BMF94_0674 [Rhodotorula taiwanensis]|uniref:EamA domain-containing protein n=1 Tax=Rhodotorula taiwanensis TaxID=741276 RepID=A0A2S5BI99_9BASI|nr:hypothetical protein BMF94_0674 [Rhodotorula taiwanensis]